MKNSFQNQIEKKNIYNETTLRDDKASMNIPSKPLRRWSKIKKKKNLFIKSKWKIVSKIKLKNKNIE
jgi:hypothetical protein